MIYYKQVQLLLRVLPFVAKESCFALKGGTAINLFIRDLPRLSVDIDLVYLPLEDRTTALKNARDALDRIAIDLQQNIPDIKAFHTDDAVDTLRLLIEQRRIQIKLELSPVMRGTVFPPMNKSVREKVEAEFGYAELPVTSFCDLYAGKICAALDRQHPRDLFDVKLLLENEGISDDLRKTFLVYLISAPRPISKILKPDLKTKIRDTYASEFLNMTETMVSIEELEDTFYELVSTIHAGLTNDEKQFLLSFKSLEPEWDLLGLDGISELPAVKWKLINLGRMSEGKHREALEILKNTINL